MHSEGPDKYQNVLRRVISDIQVMIYRRSATPIRGKDEVQTDLLLRITELNGGTRDEWRKRMIELAAYAIFAVASDQ